MKSIKLAFKPLISLTPGKRVRIRGFFGGVFSHHLQVVHVCKSFWLETLPRKYRLKKDVETIAGSKGQRIGPNSFNLFVGKITGILFVFDVKTVDALHPKRFFVNGLPRTSNQPTNQPTGGPIFVGSNEVRDQGGVTRYQVIVLFVRLGA